MTKTVIRLGRANTGLVLADMTIDFCKKISDGTAVLTEGMTMRHDGVGVYVLDNPNVTEDTTISLYKTADNTIESVGIFSLSDGDIARQSQLALARADITDIRDEALGKWVLDPVAKTLTLYKVDGVTVLKTFNLTDTPGTVPVFIGRTPV